MTKLMSPGWLGRSAKVETPGTSSLDSGNVGAATA